MPPADPAITGTAFQSSSGKAQETKPVIIAGCYIPDRVTDFRQGPKIMILLHQFLESGFFHGIYWTDDNLG
jgi:hypothetical protein